MSNTSSKSLKPAKQIKAGGLSARNLAKAFVLVALPLSMAGCKHGEAGSQVAGWSLVDPQQRHPIIVSQEPAHLQVRIAPHSQGLTPSQRAEILEFGGKYRSSDAGNSRIVLAAPSGTANEVASMAAVEEIRSLLLDAGFNEASIAVEAYSGEGSQPPVRLSYMRFVAEGPNCGTDWSENLGHTRHNSEPPNFGCTMQHNIAAQIANPADLLGPRSSQPRYGERRDFVMDKYVKGEITGAQKSEDERVRVRDAN